MIYSNYNLKSLNTFGLNATAKTLIFIDNEDDLSEINETSLSEKNIILGGGSNTVFTSDYFDGTVLLIRNKGINVVEMDDEIVILDAYAGEIWNDVVSFCAKKGWWGIENLAAVFGNVGAVAVQNIGAYGEELKECFVECTTYNPLTKEWKTYNNKDLNFGYRYSIFKNQKELEIIWKIRLRLSKKKNINTSYAAIYDKIIEENISIVSPVDMVNLVTKVRNSKLPDPRVLGNCGSFFKNPIVNESHFELLKKEYPTIPSYPAKDGVKLAAGWLIEQCGWKGKRIGNVGMHDKQALIMVNYGNAKGEEILNLAYEIEKSVKNKFNVELEKEVHIIL